MIIKAAHSQQKKEIEILYFDMSLSLSEVGRKLGINATTVLNRMKKFNLKVRSKKEAIRLKVLHNKWPALLGGEKSLGWKGGKFKTSQGYILLNAAHLSFDERDKFRSMFQGRNHNYILEHRFFMAKHINRPLLKAEMVHHLNGIQDDNRMENLLLLDGRKHRDIIPALQRRIRFLETKLERG